MTLRKDKGSDEARGEGYVYDYVEEPPDSLICPICFYPCREPQIVSCCGKKFCLACIDREHLSGKPCPLCRERGFQMLIDREHERRILALKVNCKYKVDGCQWVGELRRIEHPHLSNDCHYVPTACKYQCGYMCKRSDILYHEEECPIIGALGKWMEEGSVDLTITRVNMLGAPGAGKTCAEHLLLNDDPPSDNDSTPIACPTVRATRVAVEDQTKWKRVTNDDLLDMLAANLSASANKPDDAKEEIKKKPSTPEVASTIDHTPSVVNPVPVTPHVSPPPPDQPTSSNTIIIEDQAPPPNYRSEEVVQKILSTPPKGIRLSDHWLYIIDSGGQPAYQELLPLFTRAASLNIITLDLSKSFKEKFTLEYRIGGKYFPCHSKSTQLAIFQSAVSTGATFKPLDISHVTRKPTHSMHLVLGTHYDKVNDRELCKCEEDLGSAISSLTDYLRNCVIHRKVAFPINAIAEYMIFPVNMMAISEERVRYNEEICRAIWFHGSDASLKIEVPIRWFAFELSLPNKSIIPIGEAFSL